MSWGIYQERIVFVRFWKPSPVRAGVWGLDDEATIT